MLSTTETTSSVADRDSSRQNEIESAAGAGPGMDSAGVPPGSLLGTDFANPTLGSSGFLSSRTLSLPANTAVRGAALRQTQRSHGNQFVQRALMRGVQRSGASPAVVQRECACGGTCSACQTALSVPANQQVEPNPRSTVQRKAGSDSTAAQPGKQHLTIPNGQGEPLAEKPRKVMESRFGRDLSDVRIHADDTAATSAEAFSANAFTSGRDIYFGRGKYAPESLDGQHLLAHELVHTVQQADTASFAQKSDSSDLLIDPDEPLEQDADRVADQIISPEKSGHSAPAIQNKTWSSSIGSRSASSGVFGVAPIQRQLASTATQPKLDQVGNEDVITLSQGSPSVAPATQQTPGAVGQIVPVETSGSEDFNPGTIVNDLRRAIDQSEVTFAGYDEETIGKPKFQRKIDFDAVYKALDDRSAMQIKIVRDLYFAKEGQRTLDHDLFETGESGYPSNLTITQRARLQVLLRGTRADADAVRPEVPGYLKFFNPELAARLQSLLAKSKLPAAELNKLERTALEIVEILSDDLDGSKREQLMALHRRPVEQIEFIDAFYQSHTGANLEKELYSKLEGLQLSRMFQLRSGNIALADAFAIEDKRRAIEELDRARQENVVAESVSNAFSPGTKSRLDKQRQALVDEIDEIVARNRQEAIRAAEGTSTTAAQAVAERLKEVLGKGRDEAGRNVGDLLKITLGEPKAAELTAITNASLIQAHAQRLAETESRNETKSEQIIATIRELRAEATHDVVARAADPGLSLEEKQKLLDRADEQVQSRASEYVAQFQSAYELVRGEGRSWADIVASFKSVDEDEVNRIARGAGTMTDEEEIDLAIRRDKPDLAIAVLKRQPSQEAVHLLRMKYFALTGKWLEGSLYGYRSLFGQDERAATADEVLDSSSNFFGFSGGVATGRNAALVAEQLEKPAEKDQHGRVGMEWVYASAEREFDVTWENRGLIGRGREIGDVPETETIMLETITEIRALRERWIKSIDQHEKDRILAEMKRWRATLTGDLAAYEAENKKMLDQIRSAVSIVVQLALAVALPGAGATFMGFVRATAMQIAASVASNVVIYGEDYSLDQLRGDIVGGVLGAAGGKLGEELVGVGLAARAAKETRAAADEIAQMIAKPVAEATAKAAAKVGIRTTILKEAGSQFGSTFGLSVATGENQFTLDNLFQNAWMSGVGMLGNLGKQALGPKAQTPATQPHALAGGTHEGPTAVTHSIERETPAARAGDERATTIGGHERPAPTGKVPHEPGTTRPSPGSAELEASVERSSHMDKVTDLQASNEVDYVDRHPEIKIEGTPPNQGAKVGEHEIVELPGGGCVRHSEEQNVGCPIRFSTTSHDPKERLRRQLRTLAEEGIHPQRDLGFNEREWEQLRRDSDSNPRRALTELEARLDRHAAKAEMTSGPTEPDMAGRIPRVPKAPLDLPEIQESIEASRRALRNLPGAPGVKTVSATEGGDSTLSGSKPKKQYPFSAEATERAMVEGGEAGRAPDPHEFDRIATAGGAGLTRGSHAEKQAAVLSPDTPLGVSKPMCPDCQAWFRYRAIDRGVPQIVSDPVMTRVFMQDGSMHVVEHPEGF